MDIPLLVIAFVAKHADPMRPIEAIGQDFWRLVMSADLPGNVRELENFVTRCIALGSGPTLRNEDGCPILREPERVFSRSKTRSGSKAIERDTIVKALMETKGDKIAAARLLGIGKAVIYRKLKEYALTSI
jgi:two-component system response regulator HydG